MATDLRRICFSLAVGLPLATLDAQSWSTIFPTTTPGSRSAMAMAAGDVGGPVLLYGGENGTLPLGDTWRWTGSQWQNVPTPSGAPGFRSGASMVYDRLRRRFLLFGGRSLFGGHQADTWSFDGTAWTQLSPATSPSARSRAAMCMDRLRDRIVLFGGLNSSGPLSDTWEWNGSTWQVRAVPGPVARSGAAMAYDARNANVVMFGGLGPAGMLADTCILQSTGWLVMNLPGPVAREGAAAAYDPVRSTVVMVGGRNSASIAIDDSWEWDGTRWSTAAATGAPRVDPAMVFDATAGRMMLYGGVNQTGPLGATLVRSPFASAPQPLEWRRVHQSGPPSRSGAGIAFDSMRNQTVIFGGSWSSQQSWPPAGSSTFGTRNDCWTWDSVQWTQVASGPPAVSSPGMCFDSARGRVVLFGGSFAATGSPAVTFRQTWEWDGTSWTLRSTSGPPASSYPAMAFDSARGVTVLFGGLGTSAPHAETWEWNGTTWLQRTSTTSPPPTWGAAAAFDSIRARTVIHGGLSATALLDTTWEWDGTTWQSVSAPGSSAMMAHSMVFDTQRGNLVLTSYDALRTWDRIGNAWVQRTELQAEPRIGFSAVYDTVRLRIVMFGGRRMLAPLFVDQITTPPVDTWECAPGFQPLAGVTGTAIEFGAPCTAETTRFVPFAGYRPAAGGELVAVVEHQAPSTPTWVGLGLSDTISAIGPLPASLAAINLPGCTLLSSMDIGSSLPTVAFASGGASFRIAVPADPAFVGLVVYGQAWGISWTGIQPITVSNAIEWRIGSH